MDHVDNFVKKDKSGLLQMDNTLKSLKFKDFLNAPVALEKLKSQGKDKKPAKEKISNFDKLNENDNNEKYWITGIHLNGQETEAPEGLVSGWDADLGEMVAYQGKLIPVSEYTDVTGEMPMKDGNSEETILPNPEGMQPVEVTQPVEGTQPVEENADTPVEPAPVQELTQDVVGVDGTLEPEEGVDNTTVEDLYSLGEEPEEDDYVHNMKHRVRKGNEREKMGHNERVYENYLNWDDKSLTEFYGNHNFKK